MAPKKRITKAILNVYEKLKQKRQLQKVKDRMKSIIKTTVGEHIKLEKGESWSYDTDNKTIYYVEEGELGIKEMTTSSVIGVMLHEISHAKYSEEINRVSFPEPQRAYASLINATEDVRIEKKLMQVFPGTYDTFKDKILLAEEFLNADRVQALPPHLNLLYNYFRKKWGMPTMFNSDEVEKAFDKIEPLLDEAVAQKNTNEMEEYLHSKVWKYIEDIIPPPDPNQPPPEQGEGESGEGDEDEENKEQESGGNSKNKNNKEEKKEEGKDDKEDEKKEEEKEDEGKGKDGDDKEDDKEDEKEGDKEDGEDKEDEKEEDKEDGEGKEDEKEKTEEEKKKDKEFQDKVENSIDMEEIQNLLQDKEGEGQKKPMSMFEEASEEVAQDKNMQASKDSDFQPPTKPGNGYYSDSFKTYEELYADVASFIPYFVKKINSIMTDNKLDRSGGAYRSGKLNTKTLYKWKCNNSKLFKRKVMRQHKDYSVYLLVDQSGSMAGGKDENAAKACVLMAEVLKKSGIDFAIRGFNLSHKVYKTFDQPYNWKIKRALERIIPESSGSYAGGNNDGYNINVATHELSKRTGEKILIVISDGQPNPKGGVIPQEDMRRLKGNFRSYYDFDLKAEITKSKQNNTLIGVGINAPYVARFYPQVVLCNNIEELPNQLLNILRKNIRRG